MKILAINGSPRGAEGNTERILQPFLEGAKGAGADTETIYLKDQQIKHCLGCFSCWRKTPGQCVHRDDMTQILSKVHLAEIVVYATPLYCFGVSGMMKDFLDRRLPLLTPAINEKDGRYFHGQRLQRTQPERRVLISTAGFPGAYNFSGLKETCKVMWRDSLVGMILCAQGSALHSPDVEQIFPQYFAAVRMAGREVATEGRITPETQKQLEQELMDPQTYLVMANHELTSAGV